MFQQFGPGLVGVMFGQERQQRAADQRHVGQQIGVAAAGSILAQHSVAPPVVAHFDSAPVSANQLQPLFIAILSRLTARQVVAALGAGLAGLLGRPLALRTTSRLRA